MNIRVRNIILCAIYIFPTMIAQAPPCNQTCGGNDQIPKLPFPFGFSSGCPIQLNCSPNGTVSIGEFEVQTLTGDRFLLNLPAKCGRSINTLQQLFGRNFAPTSQNGILLQNCTSPVPGCMIPTTTVQTHFELLNCSSNFGNISCYSEQNNQSLFIDKFNLMKTRCSSLYSAISSELLSNSTAVSLDIQLIHIGWWVEGTCECSENSNCTELLSPMTGRPAYRCRCLDGFVGDGYRDGLGCWRASSKCNPRKFMSGKCGSGATQVVVLVGAVAVGACLIVGLGLLCCYIKKRTNSKTRKITKHRQCEATGISIPMYPYKEIERATNSFSDKQRLGTGAFGTVYSGKLNNDDEWVAIKRIKDRDTDSIEQVMNEITLISSVNHPNLVRLLGCSIDKGEQILIYEFMPNGTLSQHLLREKSDGLTWPVRLTIATEIAEAIAFLHSTMNPPIYHRDIKSTNILLDLNFKSKLADFGLSRLGMTEVSHISTAPQGTPGYVDPQYHQNFHLSDKSDVYSFGVVLVEIITGLKAVDFTRPQNEVNLASLAMDRIGKGCLEEIIDSFLEPYMDVLTLSQVHKVAELAFRCLAFHRDMRPSMMEVKDELEQIRFGRLVSSKEKITDSSEKPLSTTIKKPESEGNSVISLDGMNNGFSPVSVQDTWVSEQSSPSSSNLLSHVS